MNRFAPKLSNRIDALSMQIGPWRCSMLPACGAFVLLLASHMTLMYANEQGTSSSGGSLQFNRDIRPILSNKCFACHGPDEETVEAGLRLDSFETSTKVLDQVRLSLA
jgi:hypothetical protein